MLRSLDLLFLFAGPGDVIGKSSCVTGQYTWHNKSGSLIAVLLPGSMVDLGREFNLIPARRLIVKGHMAVKTKPYVAPS